MHIVCGEVSCSLVSYFLNFQGGLMDLELVVYGTFTGTVILILKHEQLSSALYLLFELFSQIRMIMKVMK